MKRNIVKIVILGLIACMFGLIGYSIQLSIEHTDLDAEYEMYFAEYEAARWVENVQTGESTEHLDFFWGEVAITSGANAYRAEFENDAIEAAGCSVGSYWDSTTEDLYFVTEAKTPLRLLKCFNIAKRTVTFYEE